MAKPLEPGDPTRVGRFELLGRLGEGGQGIVYLGRGTGPAEDRVAVKVLRTAADAQVLERLARELAAVHQVQPFVTARVIEAGTDGALRYVVSEFIDGPSLQERVAAAGPLPEGELVRLAVGTATALTAIHGAGVVHRDFKPANVLLGPDGPRVVDFGIARLADVTTMTSGVIGTPSYMAPEQLEGRHPTSAVDIFAWAVTLVFAATGRTAFSADTLAAVMHRILTAEPDLAGVPPALLPLLGRCLSKDPLRRPTARDALLAIVDPSAGQSPPAGQPPVGIDHPAPIGVRGSVPVPCGPGPAGPLPAGPMPTGPTSPLHAGPATVKATDPLGPGVAPPFLPPGPRRRRRVLAAAGAAALAAIIAVAAVLIFRSPASPTPTAGSSGSAGSGPGIPAAFAGTWSGTAMQSMPGDTQFQIPDSVTLTLTAGERTGHEQNQDCVNTLTLTTVTATVLTFDEPAVPGTCVAGTVTLTRHGSALTYKWTNGTQQNVGDLRKAG